MYRERMNDYYPKVIQEILEFQALLDCEAPEFERLKDGIDQIVTDAYLTKMSQKRIEQWENMLGIHPIEGSSVEDRRETILARIRAQSKLNTNLINTIVNTFTGGTANSWVKDGVLYVEITPPPDNKQYQFKNVEQELAKKVPAHLELRVARNYFSWNDIKTEYPTWGDIKNGFENWEELVLYVPFK